MSEPRISAHDLAQQRSEARRAKTAAISIASKATTGSRTPHSEMDRPTNFREALSPRLISAHAQDARIADVNRSLGAPSAASTSPATTNSTTPRIDAFGNPLVRNTVNGGTGEVVATSAQPANYRGDTTTPTGTEYNPTQDLALRGRNPDGTLPIAPKFQSEPSAVASVRYVHNPATWQQDIVTKHPAIGIAGSPENAAFIAAFNKHGAPERAMGDADAVIASLAPPPHPAFSNAGMPAGMSVDPKTGVITGKEVAAVPQARHTGSLNPNGSNDDTAIPTGMSSVPEGQRRQISAY